MELILGGGGLGLCGPQRKGPLSPRPRKLEVLLPPQRPARTCFYTSADEPAHDMRVLRGPGLSKRCLFLVQPENKKGQALEMLSVGPDYLGQVGLCVCVRVRVCLSVGFGR